MNEQPMINLCDCGHVEDEHDQKRHRFGPCGVAGCDCEQFVLADTIDEFEDMNADNMPSKSSYRIAMTDAGRGHLL